jgi:hypothetical protein
MKTQAFSVEHLCITSIASVAYSAACSAIRQEQIGEFGRIDLKTIRNKQAWLLNNCRNARAANPQVGKVERQSASNMQKLCDTMVTLSS